MPWYLAGALVLITAVVLGRLEVTFWRVTAVLLVALYLSLVIAYAHFRPAKWIRSALNREIALPARGDPADLYYRPSPRRLGWNWAALILGPFWYFLQGLWVHGAILLSLAFVTGGLFLPLVGVSLETWTGIIGIVLAGYALGDVLGGYLADRIPSPRLLAATLCLGGIGGMATGA